MEHTVNHDKLRNGWDKEMDRDVNKFRLFKIWNSVISNIMYLQFLHKCNGSRCIDRVTEAEAEADGLETKYFQFQEIKYSHWFTEEIILINQADNEAMQWIEGE